MAKTVEALLSLAREKLSAADGLSRMGFYRDAISRAYYGMYHGAQALLLAYGKRAIGHAGTISAFNHHFVKTDKISKKFTKWFSALKESREFADYEGLKKFTKGDVRKAIKEVEEFLKEVEKLVKK
ncbi:MAG TPA: HEPN domain-containing protein [Nevskiaceae bacterium]|nr:HEPN domain-containing protein [Nevskiaceae bacterium]